MPQFIVHKKGFFYTDENYVSDDRITGSIVGIFSRLSDAQIEKEKQDILSLKNISGFRLSDFQTWDSEEDIAISQKMKELYQKEFKKDFEYFYDAVLPENITDEQAKEILQIMGLSFHEIIQYQDEFPVNPKKFKLPEDFDEF